MFRTVPTGALGLRLCASLDGAHANAGPVNMYSAIVAPTRCRYAGSGAARCSGVPVVRVVRNQPAASGEAVARLAHLRPRRDLTTKGAPADTSVVVLCAVAPQCAPPSAAHGMTQTEHRAARRWLERRAPEPVQQEAVRPNLLLRCLLRNALCRSNARRSESRWIWYGVGRLQRHCSPQLCCPGVCTV